MGQVGRIPRKQWAKLRRLALDRDGWRCRQCGKPGRLEVDHIMPLSQGGAALDLDGLQTLCRDCHLAKSSVERNRRPNPEAVRWAELVAELLAP